MISDSKIVQDVVKEQLDKGRDGMKVYKEAYEFSLNCLKNKESQKIIDLNNQISDGIHGLSIHDSWHNLNKVAKHAMASCVSTIENLENSSVQKHIGDTMKFKLTILNMGRVEFMGYLTEDAKKEFFGNDDEI